MGKTKQNRALKALGGLIGVLAILFLLVQCTVYSKEFSVVYDTAGGEDVIIVTRGKNAVFNRVLKLPQSHKTTKWCAA